MTLKKLLGITDSTISEWELCQKIDEAIHHNVEDIEIRDHEGNLIKLHIPSLHFDSHLMYGNYGW